MLKTAKAVFNISLVRVIFIFKKVLLAGEMLKTVSMHVLLAGEMFFFIFFFFFENVLLAGEILKKLKMLKVGGTMFVSRVCTNIVPPTFNIFNFFRISPARSTFSKSF